VTGSGVTTVVWGRVRALAARVRAWRRIRFTSGGTVFTVGTTAVGFAALNTGNNLLYLLLGAMLGFIAVSGWLSEQTIRDLAVERQIPRAVTVGRELVLTYHVRNRKRRLPSMAVEISEEGLPEPAFVSHVPPDGTATASSANGFVRRGVYPLRVVTVATSFPFGLFRKERDIDLPGEIIVWPRHDLAVRDPAPGAGRRPNLGVAARGARGWRGEYRNLRGYLTGDDPRDIHWKTTARLGRPVVREYERGASDVRWICLDTRGPEGDAAEHAVEIVASLAARCVREHRPFALATPNAVVWPGGDLATLEEALDVLARTEFSPEAAAPSPPVAHEACVLVSLLGGSGFADTMVVAGEGAAA